MTLQIASNRYLFISWFPYSYSRTSVKSNYLTKTSSSFESINVSQKAGKLVFDLARIKKKYGTSKSCLIVASPCHLAVIFARILGFRKIVLDAGWSLSESTEIRIRTFILPKRLYLMKKSLLIDFFAFNLASSVFLESQCQVNYISTKFRIDSQKCHVSYTGLDEISSVSRETALVSNEILKVINDRRKVILFRGKDTKEAGIKRILEIASQLPSAFLVVIATNRNLEESQVPRNTIVLSRYLSNEEIRLLYKKSVLCLGQFGKEERLSRTIPHKIFEAAYHSRPYLTPEQEPLYECFSKDSLILLQKESNPTEIAEKICEVLGSIKLLRQKAKLMNSYYHERCSQERIAHKFSQQLP